MDESIIIRYIKGDITPEEKVKVDNWLSIPGNDLKFKEIQKVWGISKKALQADYNSNAQKAWSEIDKFISESSSPKVSLFRKFSFSKIAIAASFLILFSATWFVSQKLNTNASVETQWITINSENMAKREILLPDGSKVWLNKNSSIAYLEDFNQQERNVKLSGEAYFDVAHNKQKPFRVNMQGSTVEVLGTSFNINTLAKNGNTVVDVLTGKVSFKSENKANSGLILTKGEKGILSEDNKLLETKSDENQNYLAWKTNRLRFSGTPLNQVCESLTKYYGKKVFLNNESIKELELTATFEQQTIEEVLQVINLTLDTECTINDTSIIILKN